MSRKLTDSAKAKRKKKKNRKIEKAEDLPNHIKHSMIEGLYRIGWDAPKIIKETGLGKSTVYDNLKRFEKRGTWTPANDEATKLRATAWAKKYGSSSAAKKFKVDQELVFGTNSGFWGGAN
uniref:Uncharacterized protein n=1 Tax=Ditylenchus dipsaci TaxID=166011 RepID=A0A915ERC5_9BILA